MQETAAMPEARKAATAEDIRELLREIGEKHKEIAEQHKELAEQLKESKEAWDRSMEKSKAEHDRMLAEQTRIAAKRDLAIEKMSAKVDELSENVGGVNNSLGDMAEGLMASDLYEKFDDRGLEFDNAIPNYELKEKKTKVKLAEVDMLLLNGTIAMAVEVKTHMTQGDVDKHLKRMAILRREPNSLLANRTLYGAMASVKASKVARNYAVAKGFFVIELTGNMVKIDVPTGFTPKTW